MIHRGHRSRHGWPWLLPLLALAVQTVLAGCTPAESAGLGVRARALEVPAEVKAHGGRIGELELLAAFELTSRSTRFGGLSALANDGDDLLLLSDRARLFRAQRVEDGSGRLSGLRDWAELPLPRSLRQADTESLALLPDGGRVIGTEDHDSLFRLSADGRSATAIKLPAFLRHWPPNQGIEALTVLPDSSLLAITEGLYLAPDRVAAARLESGRATALSVRAPDGFQPSDATVAGPMLFVLERRFTLLGGLQARLLALPVARMAQDPTTPLDGREIARFGEANFAQNFEGVAARQIAPGRYRIDLVSDDNFSPLLRTLLLELAWNADQPAGS